MHLIMASRSKPQTLTLEKKIEVIKLHEKGTSARKIAQQFSVGKTQIQETLKRKAEYLSDFESNQPADRKRKIRSTGNEEVNELTWEWFKKASAIKLPVSGPIIKEKALLVAKQLGNDDFKASNGWLESFIKRHNINFGKKSGESGDVDMKTVEEWKAKLPEICDGYEPEDIYNMDESGLYYRATSDKTYYIKGEKNSGGKQSKERLTMAFCTSMTGIKEKPVVIGKVKKPRCMKNVNMSALPVHYYHNKKAWMTTSIFQDWLEKLNRTFVSRNKKILLFVDNAPSHPCLSYSNIKLCFLPPNTTSVIQPLDQGIIQAVKLKFRKLQMSHLLAMMDLKPTLTGTELTKETSILDAIYWVARSWDQVLPTTIVKCFQKGGFHSDKIKMEPTQKIPDDDMAPSHVFDRISWEVYGCAFHDLPSVDETTETTDIRTTMTDTLIPNNTPIPTDSDDEEELPQVQVTPSFKEANQALETLRAFAVGRNCFKLTDTVMLAQQQFNQLNVLSKKQSTIKDFFVVKQ